MTGAAPPPVELVPDKHSAGWQECLLSSRRHATPAGVFGGRKAIEALEAGELGFQRFCSANGSG